MSVFDDLTLQGRLFQTDSAAKNKETSDQASVCTKTEQIKPLIKQLQAHQWLTHTHIHINRTGDGECVG